MKKQKAILAFGVALALYAGFLDSGWCQNHIKELDAVRTSMADVGNRMPDMIKAARPKHIRTLERVFEINNYALVTIESYLKMIKIAITSAGTVNRDIIAILNGWLKFIRHYCEYDIKYFDEALAETDDADVVAVINAEKKNISDLMRIADRGIAENTELSKGM